MQSGNPALNKNTFLDAASGALVSHGDDVMTINGTVNKTGLLLVLALIGAMYSWSQFHGPASLPSMMPLMLGGALGGLALAMITIFKKTWAPYTAPMYALVEGVFIGGLSAIFEMRYPGIVMQAVGLTFGVMAALLLAYRSGLIRATEKFKLGVVAATGGVFLLYLANMVMGFFGHSMGFINGHSGMGIAFSAVVVVIAALNLILDFDMIESGVNARAPKYMEWYGAFALVVTLVWLYLELLRLLSKLQSRN
ncbi:MAG: Bax inhibitor-1/YccA family protein [Rhodanobacter sp.]|nr:Bax inhibitor-1/YccA family protein [Rhodanobacter sp.]